MCGCSSIVCTSGIYQFVGWIGDGIYISKKKGEKKNTREIDKARIIYLGCLNLIYLELFL